jgi:hypothetical protein
MTHTPRNKSKTKRISQHLLVKETCKKSTTICPWTKLIVLSTRSLDLPFPISVDFIILSAVNVITCTLRFIYDIYITSTTDARVFCIYYAHKALFGDGNFRMLESKQPHEQKKTKPKSYSISPCACDR